MLPRSLKAHGAPGGDALLAALYMHDLPPTQHIGIVNVPLISKEILFAKGGL